MVNSEMKTKAQKGLIWSSVERFSTQGIQFIFTIILARLLSPEDYGIIAMPMIFLAIAQIFIDSGFANALIRKPNLCEKDLSTALIFNIFVGFICYTILFIASPYIAVFYNTPILEDVLKITSLTILFNPLGTVQQAILTKKIDFKIQARVSIISASIGGIIGVCMAFYDFGVWSLAFSQAVTSLLRVLLLWKYSKWFPKTGWNVDSFNYLWGYGSKLLLAGLIDCIYQNAYPLIIGKFYTASSLGYYTRAQQFAHLPTVNVYGILRRVTFPLLSEIQQDDERMKKAFMKILRLTVYIMFPLMSTILGSSKSIILVLISDKWENSIIFLQILCIAMMVRPIDALNLNLLTIKGRTDLFLRLEIIKKILGIVILLFSLSFGVLQICIGYMFYSLIEIVVDSYYSGKKYGIGLKSQIISIKNSAIMSVLIVLTTLFVSNNISNNYISFILNILMSLIIFIGYSKLFNLYEYRELINFLKRK